MFALYRAGPCLVPGIPCGPQKLSGVSECRALSTARLEKKKEGMKREKMDGRGGEEGERCSRTRIGEKREGGGGPPRMQ